MDVDKQAVTQALYAVRPLACTVWSDQRINILTLTEGDRHNAAVRLAEHVSLLLSCPKSFKRLDLMTRSLVCEAVILGLKQLPEGRTAEAVASSMRDMGWPLMLSAICRHEAESVPEHELHLFIMSWTGRGKN